METFSVYIHWMLGHPGLPWLAFLVLSLISGAGDQETWARVSEQTARLFQATLCHRLQSALCVVLQQQALGSVNTLMRPLPEAATSWALQGPVLALLAATNTEERATAREPCF